MLKIKKKGTGQEGGLFFASPKTHLQLINSGCEVLNCVLGGGWPLGRISNVVGDKSTGKTLLAIEALANFKRQWPEGNSAYVETEAAFDDEYAKALGLDMEGIARPEVATVEDLFDYLTDYLKDLRDQPGLIIVDSLDALSDKAELGRGIAEATFGASKPKQMGQLFRRLVKPLEKSHTHVMIISQTRDNIGVSFGDKHTRSGGRALDFFASQILWLANMGQLKKTANKVTRTIGVEVKGRTKKNKLAQPFRECVFEILFGYGIDDVSSNLNFLKESHALESLNIGTSDQAVAAYKRKFMEAGAAEQKLMRDVLAAAVQSTWNQIETTFLPTKGKYA